MTTASKNTRDRLIETSTDMIWESSYGSVSVDDICKAAGVQKGSFYHYFPSKIDLAVASMGQAYDNFRPIMDDVFSSSRHPVERFEEYAKLTYEIQKEITKERGRVCGCPFASLGAEMAPQDDKIRKKTDEIIGSHKEYYKTALRDMVAEGCLPKETCIEEKAEQIYAFVMGQMVMARIRNSLTFLKRDLRSGLFRLMELQDIKK